MTPDLARKRCFFFDLDGTLIDSTAAHAKAFHRALEEGHLELAGEFEYERIRGMDTPSALRFLGVGENAVTQVARRKREVYRDLVIAGGVPPLEGARELLTALRRAERSLFLVTNASRGAAELALEHNRLRPFFDGVITADDVTRTKPAPEPFLRALSLCGHSPEACLTVEDSLDGLDASLKAGIDAVLVRGRAARATASFDSLPALHRSLGLGGCAG